MNLLDSPRWKLGRSEDHAQALANEARKFAATHKYRVIRERDTQRGCDVLRMKLAGKPPLPLTFGCLAGECVGSFRCALDHLVWAMSKNPLKPSSVEFPIFIDPDAYKRDAPKRISTIPDEAKREIERLQPYHAGDAKLFIPCGASTAWRTSTSTESSRSWHAASVSLSRYPEPTNEWD